MEFPTVNGDSRSPPSHPLTVDLQKVNSKIKVFLYSHLFPNTCSLIIGVVLNEFNISTCTV